MQKQKVFSLSLGTCAKTTLLTAAARAHNRRACNNSRYIRNYILLPAVRAGQRIVWLNYPARASVFQKIARARRKCIFEPWKKTFVFFRGKIYYLFSPLADIRRPVDSEAIHTPWWMNYNGGPCVQSVPRAGSSLNSMCTPADSARAHTKKHARSGWGKQIFEGVINICFSKQLVFLCSQDVHLSFSSLTGSRTERGTVN